jgi:lysophospholipase L1-like esterase
VTRTSRKNLRIGQVDADSRYATSAAVSALSAYTYNVGPTTTQKWRQALGRVRSGTGSAKLLCAGDSTTWGARSGASNSPQNGSYPAFLANLFNSYYAPSAIGLAVANPATGASGGLVDTRWGVGSGWTYGSAYGFGKDAAFNSGSATTALTFTPGVNCDSFDIYFLQSATVGKFYASIDGGASTLVTTTTGGTLAIGKVNIPASAAGTAHVLSITPASSADRCYISAAEARLSTAKQIYVGNAGVCGSTSVDWADATGYNALGAIKTYAPDLTLLMLGINDSQTTVNTSPAQWQTNMQAVIGAAQVSGDVIVMSVVPSQVGYNAYQASVELQYKALTQAMAVSTGCGYIDINSRFVDYVTANAAGWMADGVHPTAPGYADLAGAVFTALRTI